MGLCIVIIILISNEMQLYTVYFIWKLLYIFWYYPKHVEQFPDKINCVKLHLVGY